MRKSLPKHYPEAGDTYCLQKQTFLLDLPVDKYKLLPIFSLNFNVWNFGYIHNVSKGDKMARFWGNFAFFPASWMKTVKIGRRRIPLTFLGFFEVMSTSSVIVSFPRFITKLTSENCTELVKFN